MYYLMFSISLFFILGFESMLFGVQPQATIHLIEGDLIRQKVDAIVNSANNQLTPHSELSEAIFRAPQDNKSCSKHVTNFLCLGRENAVRMEGRVSRQVLIYRQMVSEI